MGSRRTILFSTGLAIAIATSYPAAKRRLRRSLSAYMDRLLRKKAEPWPARDTSRPTLIFAPHQDDGVLGCGGLIASRCEAGENVHIAYITDGSASHPGHPRVSPAQMAALRMEEARLATSVAGVPPGNLHFLNAPDSRLPHLDPATRAQLVDRLRELIVRLNPAEVFITSAHDGSSEHTAANALVADAIRELPQPPRLLNYVVWARWNPRCLWRPYQLSRHVYRLEFERLSDRKQAALRLYRTQVEPLAPWTEPVLSTEFLSFFKKPEEFFFET